MPTGHVVDLYPSGAVGSVADEESKKVLYAPQKPVVAATTIAHLGTYRLVAPLMVVLEYYLDEVVAHYPEVDAWGAGATPHDAIRALKRDIVNLYESMADDDETTLGAGPLSWKRALGAMIVEG